MSALRGAGSELPPDRKDDESSYEKDLERLEQMRREQVQHIGELTMPQLERIFAFAHHNAVTQVYNEGLPGPGNGAFHVDGYNPTITVSDGRNQILKRPNEKE